ncbi:MAG TPA: phosphate acyltransferase [Cellvibrionaceae bacterium]|nr:phosphate acyltransferase [Cellvibrionaceae bacterium]
MAAAVRIAVDGMGGDFGPRLAFEACCIFLQQQPRAEIDLFVVESFAAPFACPARLRLVMCPLAVLPADNPTQVLRHKQASSMGQALVQLRDGAAQACVSAGNTGGLVMLAAHLLGIRAGVTRPVLCTAVPTAIGATWLLDLGGVLAPDADRLVEYAHLGAQQARRVLKRPVTVALLNLGQEDEKGPLEVKAAAQRLKISSEFEYVGFVEPAGLFAGAADVVVCEGLVGNMVLKSAEAAAATVLSVVRREFSASPWRRLLALFCRGVFGRVRRQLHPARLNGALLLGVNGVVVKSHGGADQEGFLAALNLAYRAVRSD